MKQTRNINNVITFKEKNSDLLALTRVHITQQTDTKIIQNIIIKKKIYIFLNLTCSYTPSDDRTFFYYLSKIEKKLNGRCSKFCFGITSLPLP